MMVLAASDMRGAKVNKTKENMRSMSTCLVYIHVYIHTYIHTFPFPSGVVHISDTEVTQK